MSIKQKYYQGEKGFEAATDPNDLFVKGSCWILEGQSTAGFEEEPNIPPTATYGSSNKMIQLDQSFALSFKWTVYGKLACLLDCGYWKCQVFFEQMGGGETAFNPEENVQDVGHPGHSYEALVKVQPGALQPGVYRVICCLQYHLKDGSPGPIAAFEDRGLIKIYQDKVERHHHQAATVENGVTTA